MICGDVRVNDKSNSIDEKLSMDEEMPDNSKIAIECSPRTMEGNNAHLHQQAVEFYDRGKFEDACITFSKLIQQSQVNDIYELSLAADRALCRFRASGNIEFQKEVLYREAIRSNEIYSRRIKSLENSFEFAFSAAISAIWIHTKMDNLKMARYKAWATLQWAYSRISSNSTIEHKISNENLLPLLSTSIPQKVLKKFFHVLDVLNVLQGEKIDGVKAYSLPSAFHDPERLVQQKEALKAIVRWRSGVAPEEELDSSHEIEGIKHKVHQLMFVIERGRSHSDENFMRVADHSNPSDLHMLGQLQTEPQKELEFYRQALQHLPFIVSEQYVELSFSIADCLDRLQEYGMAKEIFSWLVTLTSYSKLPSNIILLGKKNMAERNELLWRGFLSSTLDDDQVTCLAISDLLFQEKTSNAASLSYAFSLYQADRTRLAKQKFKDANCFHLWSISGEIIMRNQDELNGSPLLKACYHNNVGLNHLQNGDMDNARISFEKACQMLMNASSNYLHPFYNLSLLFLQTGSIVEACNIWATCRPYDSRLPFKIKAWLSEALNNYAGIKAIADKKIEGKWLSKNIGGLSPSNVLLLDILFLQHKLQEWKSAEVHKMVQRIGKRNFDV